MIPNKDLSIDSENGKIILNGDKYDLGTQGEIDTAVKGVYSVMGQMGAKNLNIFPYKNGGAGDTWETNGITYTVNADGTIEADGTATADAYFRCGIPTDHTNPIYLEEGKSYILSGSGSNDIDILLRDSTNTNIVSASATDTVYNCTTSGNFYVLMRVKNGKTVNHHTIKPMLRLASDTDNTYEPYAMTNKQLTDRLATKQDALTFDTTPTDASTNPVTSGGIYNTIGDITQTGVTGASVAAQIEALDGAIKKTTVNTSTSANGNILIEMLQSEKTVLGCLLTRTDTGAGIISDLYTYDVSGTLYWGAHCRDANAAGAAVTSTAVTGYVYYIDKPAINS